MSEEQNTRKIQLRLSPEAERYIRQDAPVDVRLMAAGGSLPLPPVELLTVLFALSLALPNVERPPDGTSLAGVGAAVVVSAGGGGGASADSISE